MGSRPNEVMDWATIKWAKSRGYCYYDLDGIEAKAAEALAELIRFREQWTKGLLPEDFYANRVFGLGRVWLGLRRESNAKVSAS